MTPHCFEDLPNWYLQHGMFSHQIHIDGTSHCFPEIHKDFDFLQNVRKLNISARGLFFYPKGSFREWHTNENDAIGVRYYIIYSDTSDSGMNFLVNDKVVTIYDKPNHVNIFSVFDHTNPCWHNVFSNCNRFSLGLMFN